MIFYFAPFLLDTVEAIGCYRDGDSRIGEARALPDRQADSQQLTNEMCAQICRSMVSTIPNNPLQ